MSAALGVRHREDIARFLRQRPRAIGLAPTPGSAPTDVADAPPLRVLFIGNSLTATHDIPGMVARLARAAKQPRPFVFKLDTPGGFGLSQHAVTGRLRQHLQQRWDTVVLQEQGQRPGWPRTLEEQVVAPARVLDRAIRASGARTLLYVTNARREGDADYVADDSYDAMQARIGDGYSRVARELNAALVPVGTIWQSVYHERPTLRLWMPDGLHPSVAGSYLAACAFYAHFYRDSPLGNTYVAGLDAADAHTIQQSAAEVMLGWRSAGAAMNEASSPPTPESLGAATTPFVPDVAAPSESASQAYADTERDRERHAQIEADRQARALRRARTRVPIALYSTPWCGYCKQARAYMREAGIAFDEYDIDEDRAAKAAVRRLNPRGSVPTIDVAGTVLIGWNQTRFEKTLERAARADARL